VQWPILVWGLRGLPANACQTITNGVKSRLIAHDPSEWKGSKASSRPSSIYGV